MTQTLTPIPSPPPEMITMSVTMTVGEQVRELPLVRYYEQARDRYTAAADALAAAREQLAVTELAYNAGLIDQAADAAGLAALRVRRDVLRDRVQVLGERTARDLRDDLFRARDNALAAALGHLGPAVRPDGPEALGLRAGVLAMPKGVS